MHKTVYRYQFNAEVSMVEVEASILLAILATESLHSTCDVQLAAPHYFDAAAQACVVDVSTPVGNDFNRLLLGFLRREFGPRAFEVRQVDAAEPSGINV